MEKDKILTFSNHWVQITRRDGRTISGFIDDVGINHTPKKIVIADRRPIIGEEYTGVNIAIDDIVDIRAVASGACSFGKRD